MSIGARSPEIIFKSFGIILNKSAHRLFERSLMNFSVFFLVSGDNGRVPRSRGNVRRGANNLSNLRLSVSAKVLSTLVSVEFLYSEPLKKRLHRLKKDFDGFFGQPTSMSDIEKFVTRFSRLSSSLGGQLFTFRENIVDT